ncbi:hypothetical protein LOZ66_001360 [Ophidiomyces ophidiicola]|nr:hypothetical protein LOZ66_001360 [Ophidiomyces ophidiicola]
MSADDVGKYETASLPRGLFANGELHCDCDPRLPVARFQTRNGGKNQGRWFYTCSRSKRNQCGFFLWEDESTRLCPGRAMLANSRSDAPGDPPETPSIHRTRDAPVSGLLTPETGGRRVRFTDDSRQGSSKRRRVAGAQRSSSFMLDWLQKGNSSSEGEGEGNGGVRVEDQPAVDPAPDRDTNPGDAPAPDQQPDNAADAAIPNKPVEQLANNTEETPLIQSSAPPDPPPQPRPPLRPPIPLFSANGGARPADTPAPARCNGPSAFTGTYNLRSKETQHCKLISQTLTLLAAHGVVLDEPARDDLVSLLDRYDLRTEGIIRGRDISRAANQAREEKIQMLLGRIKTLEAEKEARDVIK